MKFIRLGVHGMETCLIVLGICFLLLRAGGITAYVVLSGSMEPAVETGAMVFVNTKERDYRIGDIVTYQIADQLVTHRIVKMENGIYTTKGDANQTEDSIPVKKSQILGKVKIVIPTLGYVLSYMKSKKIILSILSILLLSNLFDILSENNTRRNDAKIK